MSKLRIFDTKPGSGFNCLLKCDVVKELERWKLKKERETCKELHTRVKNLVSSKAPRSSREANNETCRQDGCIEVERGSHILRLFYFTTAATTASTATADTGATNAEGTAFETSIG